MSNILKRQQKASETELSRLYEILADLQPTDDQYDVVMRRIDQLDKINNRSSELTKTVIPALGTIGSVAGIYVIQQFAGVIVPKALDAIASRSPQKYHQND